MEQERRSFRRVPALSVVKEALIESPELNLRREIPAIVSNVSAGGIAIITFISLPLDAIIYLNFDIDGLRLKNVEGRIIRVEGRKNIFQVAIAFTKIDPEIKNQINMMAEALDLCETRMLIGEQNVCSVECAYYRLCSKPVKLRLDN